MEISGLLYSQIGYDLKDPMRALVRSTDPDKVPEGSVFDIIEAESGSIVFQGEVRKWGALWKSTWWELDFSALDRAGSYRIVVRSGSEELFASGVFKVGAFVLWQETVHTVAIEQLEERARLARNGKGWKDCGSSWKEANSHATTIIGLSDLLSLGYEHLTAEQNRRLAAQIIQGCDYLALCQDKAQSVGYPEGAIVHEIPNHMLVIPGDVAQSVVAFTRASRLLTEIDSARSGEYQKRAVKAYEYLLYKAQPIGGEGFSAMNHGAPEGFQVPREFMTRDLLMMMWGGVELWSAGQQQFRDAVIRLARQVMDRQVGENEKEGEFYGHFRTFDHCNFTEKANTHHHVGHDTGSTFPHYIIPFMEMLSRWYDHPEAPRWRKTVQDFAYGYFLPACSKNPFYLLPEGYFTGEGLLVFCGPWHGINTSIVYAASLAVRLEGCTGDKRFRQIAVGNIQWIAGLNAGITKESLKGCVIWREEIPEGKAIPYSQIHGIGERSVGCWTDIKGTIVNGFDVNPQFQLVVPPTAENDGPWLFTDEDWIPHAAGWVSALSVLRDLKFFADIPAV